MKTYDELDVSELLINAEDFDIHYDDDNQIIFTSGVFRLSTGVYRWLDGSSRDEPDPAIKNKHYGYSD